MKRLIYALAVLPTLAMAQQQPAASAQEQLLGAAIGQLYIENARLAVELRKAQEMIQALQREQAKAKTSDGKVDPP